MLFRSTALKISVKKKKVLSDACFTMVFGKETKLLLALKMPNIWQVPQIILIIHSWVNSENAFC